MERDIVLELKDTLTKELKSCTHVQGLTLALLGLERTWQMFLDWTCREHVELLLCKPETLRAPVREALDLLWEQVYEGQTYNRHRDVFDRLRDQIDHSFEEEDGPDVDFGTAAPLVDAFYGSASCFFEVLPERRYQRPWCEPDFYVSGMAFCTLAYAEALSNFLYDEYSASVSKDSETIFNCMEKDPLWVQEVQRIESDLELVRGCPMNKDRIEQRRNETRELRTPPFCK